MKDILLFTLSLIGLLALYWVFIGQAKWNKMLRDNQDKEPVLNKKEDAKKE